MDMHQLEQELIIDEGEKLISYLDSLGLWTIGIGHLIDPRKGANPAPFGVDLRNGGTISQLQSRQLFAADVDLKMKELDARMPWWRSLSENRQRVLLNMAFQLGVSGLLAFRKAVAAMQAGQFQEAKAQMLDSAWAKTQTPARARRLADRMAAG